MNIEVMGCIERAENYLDLYLRPDKPLGEESKEKKINIPKNTLEIMAGDSMDEHLKIKNASAGFLLGIPTLITELGVERSYGYDGEIDENYWIFILGFEDIVGIQHSSSYIERKGYDHSYTGPFRPSYKQLENLMAVGIDLKEYSAKFKKLFTSISNNRLEEYVEDKFKLKYDSIEKQIDDLQTQYIKNDGFGTIGSRWDITFHDFSSNIKRDILSVAKNKQEATTLIDSIFGKIRIKEEKGGDHHSGYGVDFIVFTNDALALAEDTTGLRKLLKKAASSNNLEEFINRRFEERYSQKDKEVSEMVGPQDSWSDEYHWSNLVEFSNEAKRSVFNIAESEREVEIALDIIFNELDVSSSGVSGAHHGVDYQIYSIGTSTSIRLAKDSNMFSNHFFVRLMKERLKNIRYTP